MKRLSTVIDVEASALDRGYPLEIGVAKYDGQSGKIVHSSMLIRHDPWLEKGLWSSEAEKIHGITKQEIYDKGRPLREACSWLNETVGPHTAHVGDMRDKMWLSQMFDAAGRAHIFQLDYIGAFMEAAAISQKNYFDFLGDLQHRAGQDALRMARALYDCMALRR